MKEGTSAQLSGRGELHGGARVTTLVTLRKCTLGNKREIKTLKFVSASTKGVKGGLAWIKPSKKDMAVTFSYSRDPRLRLVHPTRAKKDAHTGPRVTPDGLHLHVGGYRRRDGLSPPTRGAAYHPPAALMYILRDVLAESEHQEPNADVAWPEPLRPRPHAPTPLWLVTTDDQCSQAMGQPQLRAEWVIVQVGAGQPEPRGLPRGTALLVATGVPHDPHMAVHVLEDQPEDTGHLVVHQRGGPAWLKEHVTALRSWASTITGAEIRLHDHPAISPGDTRALSVDQLTPSHPDVRWHSADLNAGWLSPTGYY